MPSLNLPDTSRPAASPGNDAEAEPAQIEENISAVLDFYNREEQKISTSQRLVERISHFVARPAFLTLILFFVASWILINLTEDAIGIEPFDPSPFVWLQGTIGLFALLTSVVVLAKQDRLARLGERREHLDLKIALLTEQKVAKLIDLIEELRRDLPNVKDRHDSDAATLRQAMKPEQVLAALDERGDPQKSDEPAR